MVNIITFPNIEESKNEFKGVIINKIINTIDNADNMQVFCVAFENSIIIVEDIVTI